jgi:nitrogen fixation protein NifZ
MIAPPVQAFVWGQRVTPLADLLNDGSFPDLPADALLAAAGDVGEVVQTGWHEEAEAAVYLVEFASGRVVGCFESEIAAV